MFVFLLRVLYPSLYLHCDQYTDVCGCALCVYASKKMFHVFLQSKSASSTDSQPPEERQGPSGGYSSSQGGAEAKRRRCDDKEPLAPHSYVRDVCVLVLKRFGL